MHGSRTTSLLTGLLRAQARDNELVAYPHVQTHAQHVIDWASGFEQPVLIPIGAAAQRLLGVATVLACGSLDLPIYLDRLDGRDVLLLGTVTASLVEFEAAANNARRRGAKGVHGCAIEMTGQTHSAALDSFTLLHEDNPSVRRSA